jgi:hypothetical protein
MREGLWPSILLLMTHLIAGCAFPFSTGEAGETHGPHILLHGDEYSQRGQNLRRISALRRYYADATHVTVMLIHVGFVPLQQLARRGFWSCWGCRFLGDSDLSQHYALHVYCVGCVIVMFCVFIVFLLINTEPVRGCRSAMVISYG